MKFFDYLRENILIAIFALVGGLGLAAAGYFSYDTISFLSSAERTDGVVVDFKHRAGNATSPIIHYRLPDGTVVEYTATFESSTNLFDIGEAVQMLYLPTDPRSTARIDSLSDLWLLPIIFGVIGVVFVGIPFGVWVYDRRTSADTQGMSLQERMEEIRRNKRNTMLNTNGATSQISNKLLRIFPAIGVFLLLLAGFFAWKQYQFTQTAPQYKATVIANEWRSKSIYPVYEFIDSHGDTIHAYGTVGSNPPMFAVGESTDILYDERDNSADARGFFIEWFAPLILGFIGTLLTGIGLILVRVFR